MPRSSKLSVAPSERANALRRIRNLKMARSAHAYVRGSTQKFYEWLDQTKTGTIPDGPPVWICGDCHLGNLGPLADIDGRINIQIRDLDQTVIGNPAHDLVRLGLSLAMAARSSDLPGVTTAQMLEQMMLGYEHALVNEEPDLTRRRPDCVSVKIRQAVGRTWGHLAEERIEDARPTIPKGRKFWPLTGAERKEIDRLFESEDIRQLVTSLRDRPNKAKVEVLDAAYWVKGCSSLGRLRFAVLVGLGSDVKKRNRYCLIDIKEAVRAAAPRDNKSAMPRENASRVAEGAKHLSPALGDRVVAARLLDHGVFIRELLPQDLKLEVDQISRDEAMKASYYLAMVVGKAHARQMALNDRKVWQDELYRNRSGALDAPNWLWSSIVDLVASHEAAYLQHCRRYAIDPDAAD
jgi:uncharacterized protein (DUF2252 family)